MPSAFDAAPLPTQRAELLARLAQAGTFDLAIVGGGATGLGVALDAAARGFKVALVEALDFAKGDLKTRFAAVARKAGADNITIPITIPILTKI